MVWCKPKILNLKYYNHLLIAKYIDIELFHFTIDLNIGFQWNFYLWCGNKQYLYSYGNRFGSTIEYLSTYY